MADVLRVLVTVLALACLLGFTTGVAHARDNTDRVYLIGTSALLFSSGVGSISHLNDPAPYGVIVAICLTVVGQVLLLCAAAKSRRRRRTTPPGGASG